MTIQDWTTYVEVDPAQEFSVSASQINISLLARTSNAWSYKDWGVGYFVGDIECLATVRVSAMSASGAGIGVCSFSNNLNGLSAETAGIYVWVGGTATAPNIQLTEIFGASFTVAPAYVSALSTSYYLKLVLDRAVGAFGTVYLYIYSDAARTVLIDTQTIALSAVYNYRYSYALRNYAIPSGGQNISAFLYDGDITIPTVDIAAVRKELLLTTHPAVITRGGDVRAARQPLLMTTYPATVLYNKNVLAITHSLLLKTYPANVSIKSPGKFSVTVKDARGNKIVGATKVLFSAVEDSTGHRFDFSDKTFKPAPAEPTLQLVEPDAVNHAGYYWGEVDLTDWDGKITETITYNEGLSTFQEWEKSSVRYSDGVEVNTPTSQDVATAVVDRVIP